MAAINGASAALYAQAIEFIREKMAAKDFSREDSEKFERVLRSFDYISNTVFRQEQLAADREQNQIEKFEHLFRVLTAEEKRNFDGLAAQLKLVSDQNKHLVEQMKFVSDQNKHLVDENAILKRRLQEELDFIKEHSATNPDVVLLERKFIKALPFLTLWNIMRSTRKEANDVHNVDYNENLYKEDPKKFVEDLIMRLAPIAAACEALTTRGNENLNKKEVQKLFEDLLLTSMGAFTEARRILATGAQAFLAAHQEFNQSKDQVSLLLAYQRHERSVECANRQHEKFLECTRILIRFMELFQGDGSPAHQNVKDLLDDGIESYDLTRGGLEEMFAKLEASRKSVQKAEAERVVCAIA